ncbi:HNH endonuclease signature motif containing protein [Williamsia sp. CHRR-6]|uniref:HNH endonuclease signature motif containing protein n=1 Tax=Williamsia sp. CHRR-6 TaxID=2835871 RepID=UPI001BD98BC8|nr:HNH endonuclease signature motif containing protein [Williamsia sp. CHRR-6]MBT0567616.1 DUF222 domain-containing protein [Williamsia sp. CHRR-6]
MSSGAANPLSVQVTDLSVDDLLALRDAIADRLLQPGALLSLTDAQVVTTAQRVERQARRDEALTLDLTAAMRERSMAAKIGLRPSAHLSQVLRLSKSEASARVKDAELVAHWHDMTGELAPASLPATAAALRDGDISRRHLRVIHSTLQLLPASVRSDERWHAAEKQLGTLARTLDIDELTAVGKRLVAYLNPDGELTADRDRHRRRGLSVSRQDVDHMSALTGQLDPATRALWDVVAEKWARPGVNNPDDPDSPTGSGDGVDPAILADAAARDTRTPQQRQHDAFRRLLETTVAAQTLGSHRGMPAQIVVTMTLTELEQATGVATTASGGTLPVRDALTLAGDSRPFLALLDHADRPLFLGRTQRLATINQRLALFAAERGCGRPECDSPFSRVAVHHMVEWRNGGRTDITTLTGACDACHALVHDGPDGWITEVIGPDTGPPQWWGRVGWRQRSSGEPLRPNDRHVLDRTFHAELERLRDEMLGVPPKPGPPPPAEPPPTSPPPAPERPDLVDDHTRLRERILWEVIRSTPCTDPHSPAQPARTIDLRWNTTSVS